VAVAQKEVRPGFHPQEHLAPHAEVVHVAGADGHVAHAAGDDPVFGKALLKCDARDPARTSLPRRKT